MSNPEVLLALFKDCKKIQGRKRVQKIVFILKSLGAPLDFPFFKYHYGPFSRELETALDYLSREGLLNETIYEFSIEGEPRKVYVYSITNKGEECAKSLGVTLNEYGIDDELLQNLQKKNLDELVKLSYSIYDNDISKYEILMEISGS